MRRHRSITTAALAALALCCVAPSTAGASSTLLSGYGGPGEGSQAILGSSLTGTGGGSSGRGGGSGGGSTATGTASLEATTPSQQPATTAHGGSRPAAEAGRGGGSTGASKKQGSAGSSKGAAGAYPSPSPTADVGSEPLGVSGSDLLYIILGFAALALTAIVTGRLSGRPGPSDPDAGR